MEHKATTIRFTDDDRQVIDRLKQHLGLTSTTQLIRLALRLALEKYEAGAASAAPVESEGKVKKK